MDSCSKKSNHLHSFKAGYFVYFAGLSCVHPFLSLLLSQLGLSAREVSLALLVKPIAGVLGGATLCGFADQHQCHRFVLTLSVTASAIAIQWLWWSPKGMGVILLLFFCIGFFSAPISSIVDSLCAHYIELSVDCQGATYSEQRLWGAVGWGIFAAFASLLVDCSSSWAPAFALHACFSLATLWITYGLTTRVTFRHEHGSGNGCHDDRDEGNRDEERGERPFMEKIGMLQETRGASLFLGLCVVFGIQTGAIEGWLFPVLSQSPGSSEFLFGLSLSVTCLSESLIFWKSDAIVGWIDANAGVVNVCFAAFAVRLGAYTLLKYTGSPAWIVLFIEPLHGLTFALTWTWLISEAKQYGSRIKLESFCVAVATAAMFNVGYACGGLTGGLAFGVAPVMTFIPGLVVLLVCWVWYALIHIDSYSRRQRGTLKAVS